MEKEAVINVMELPDDVLKTLYAGESVGEFEFCNTSIERHANGFQTDLVIFKKGDLYFKFLAINYLDEEQTFTKPFQVFKSEEKVTRTYYSNWVDVAEES